MSHNKVRGKRSSPAAYMLSCSVLTHPTPRFWFNLPSSPEQTEYSLEVNIYGVVQGRKQDEPLESSLDI